MSDLTDQLAADFAAAVGELPTPATWEGGSCAGIFTDYTKNDANKLGGFVPDYQATFHAPVASIVGTAPNTGTVITVSGKRFKVGPVVVSPDGVEVQWQLDGRK